MAPRRDWPTIRAAYVEGFTDHDGNFHEAPSLFAVAKHFGAENKNLAARAARENWTEARALHQRRVDEARSTARSNEIARIAGDLDLTAVRVARDGLTITHARMQELGVASRQRTNALLLEQGDPTRAAILAAVDPVDALELDRLSRAADAWYVLATKAIGLGPRTSVDVNVELTVTEEERDARTMQTLALVREYAPDLLPPGFGDVIDVESGLSLVAGNGEGGAGSDLDAENQRVHPSVADGGEPQR